MDYDYGQSVYFINIMLDNKKGTYAEIVPSLNRYIM